MNFSIEDIEKIYKGRFTPGNEVELLAKGEETFGRIFDALRGAERFICLEFYMFRNDETGSEFAEILMEKAKQGIDVYLLYDHFGSFGTPRKFWRALREAGVNVKASYPFIWASPRNYMHRDHKKLLIVDGHTAFTGGINIANEYRGFRLRKKMPWRDTGILVRGPLAANLLKTFSLAWARWKGTPIMHGMEPAAEMGCLPVLPIFAHSGKGRRRMRRLIYYSINHSRKSILLTSAYFTPSRRMIETIENAVRRGVLVRLVVPGESDVPAALHAGRAFYQRLLKAGVEIYSYSGEVLHAKTYVFDGYWSIVGSANLDFRSMRWNDEGNAGILDAGFGRRMTELFNEDVGHSEKLELEGWLTRPLGQKLKERFFSLLRRRL